MSKIYKWSIAFVVLCGLSACCSNDDPPPPPAIEFAVYDSTGEDNLFDEDGPYSMDSLGIFLDDGSTPSDFFLLRDQVTFYVGFSGGAGDEVETTNTFLLHTPDGVVDTLVGYFNFEESRCLSYWYLDYLTFNSERMEQRNDYGAIKLLRQP